MGSYRRPVQLIIFLGVLLLGGYAVGNTLFAGGSSLPATGKQPPEFALSDLAGGEHRLSDYAGKPVVLNFWGSFCPPCVKEMPEFEKQYGKWKATGLTILAVNLSEDDLTVRNFVGRFQLSYPILRDVNRQTERSYGLRQYPTTFFIGSDGTVRHIFVGGMTEAQIDEQIALLLGK
ncbi:redoxin domain-containing protein [Paenibacillus beijingensis]|uniref:Thiol-disulfide oxidoreductase n=1 Tax=Paenibacillus beijingensis TaxID=1126833 RepID=A0A0D5NPI5_9BACL|nr:redoxin domain-containing protein [Paenibacillus beijingensis]AJY77209.1 thiol-disulfide oxidoreductase [Paenibacillus beijingensis]